MSASDREGGSCGLRVSSVLKIRASRGSVRPCGIVSSRSPMKTTPPQDVTKLLRAWSDGDAAALNELMPYVYAELHRIARLHMAGERPMHTLQASALIHEAYIRLAGWEGIPW